MMNKHHKRIYNEILTSLETEPDKWRITSYKATNGLYYVWVSNRYYATRFGYGSLTYDRFNVFWFLFPWQWWRVKLIRAVENAQAHQLWG